MVNKQYRSHINFPFSRIERECYSTKVIKKKWGQTVGHANSTCILFIAFSSLNHVFGTRFVTGDYASQRWIQGRTASPHSTVRNIFVF